MALPHFQPGARVRTVRDSQSLPKGSRGTIVRVFVAAACSDVHFDVYPGHRLVYHGDLELIDRESEAELPTPHA